MVGAHGAIIPVCVTPSPSPSLHARARGRSPSTAPPHTHTHPPTHGRTPNTFKGAVALVVARLIPLK
jgi:hypothetical protein